MWLGVRKQGRKRVVVVCVPRIFFTMGKVSLVIITHRYVFTLPPIHKCNVCFMCVGVRVCGRA